MRHHKSCWQQPPNGVQGAISKAKTEAVTQGAMVEASFRLLALEHKGCSKPGPYYLCVTSINISLQKILYDSNSRLLPVLHIIVKHCFLCDRSYRRWLKAGMPASEAYTERAAIHSMAKCYLQVHWSVTPVPSRLLPVSTKCNGRTMSITSGLRGNPRCD